jgi:hypothetical protein
MDAPVIDAAARGGPLGLGAPAGEAWRAEVPRKADFTTLGRAAETPANEVFEVKR